MPPYAILRHVKVVDKKQADKATAHNYRQYEVPNADQEAKHPNVEFVNTEQRDYWELATERIKEADITIRRKDQIRCVEIVLTASPEFFKRDAEGKALDYSQEDWTKAVRTYLIETFGEKNLIACQLQQDEKSPHVHAVVVPITEDGRLSARDLFNPGTLRGYQTEFARRMEAFGLERGVEHSQAKHQPMQQMYGQQNKTAAELDKQMGEASSYQDEKVKRPAGKDVFNLSAWEDKTTARVNEQARAQVEEANKRAEKAHNLALENAAAKEQVRVLQKQLSTAEALKEANQKTQDDLYKRLAGEEKAPRAVLERGNELLDKALSNVRVGRVALEMVRHQVEVAKERFDIPKFTEENEKMRAQEAKNKVMEADLGRYAGGRARLEELEKQLAKEAAEKVRKAQEQAQWEKDAPAREAQRKLDQVQQDKQAYEGEKLKIERICGEILKTDTYVMQLSWFAVAARERGLQVDSPSEGQLTLSVPGSKNRFAHQDLAIGGKELTGVLNAQMKANREANDREREKGNDRGR